MTLPSMPMPNPHQPTVVLTTSNQLEAIKTVPTAQNHQAILFRFMRANWSSNYSFAQSNAHAYPLRVNMPPDPNRSLLIFA